MLGETFLKEAPLEIQRLMLLLQEYSIRDIARRIAKYGHITSSAEYQLTTMMEQNIFNRNFKAEIQKILGLSQKQINALFQEAAKANYIYDKRAFRARGIPLIPYESNQFMQVLVDNIIGVTNGTLNNITGSLGFAERIGGQIIFKPIAQFYQSQLDLATTSITTGVKTFNKAVKDSVLTMANSGLRTVDYASGHMDRIDVAARRAVMGGMRDLTNAQSDYNSTVMETTVFEISWHGGYRPSHAWGGRRFDTTGKLYPTEEQLYKQYPAPDGTVGKLEDYNCYHEKYAVFPDSPPTYTETQLVEMDKQQKALREFQGKYYNAHEARQQQRYMERVLRKQNSVIAGYKGALETAPDSRELADDLRNARIKKTQLRGQYRAFSEAMGLTTEFERVNTGLT